MSRAGSNGPAPGRRPAPPPNPPAPASVRMWWDGGERAITAREKATIEEHGPSSFSIPLVPATPSARWAADALPDPHGDRYACERAALTLGNLTDDELANAVFLHGNEQPTMADLAAGKALAGIVYLTAAKDRIRWLSRALADAIAPQPAELAEQQGVELPPLPEAFEAEFTAPGVSPVSVYTAEQMQDYARAALAARQPGPQVPVASIAPRHLFLMAGKDGTLSGNVLRFGASMQPGDAPLYAAPPAQGIDLVPRPMDTAPRDGTMVRLLVQFTEHATEDTDGPSWTIGANNGEHDGGDLWCFAGWCWTHDHFTEGKGTPVGWLPLIDGQRDTEPGASE